MAKLSGLRQWTPRRPDLLGIYLNDHLAAATAGAELFARTSSALAGTPGGAALERMRQQVEEDRRSLQEVMQALAVPQRRYKVYAAWAAEKAGRLKPNGAFRNRSPLSTLLELEALLVGVHGKASLWRTLRALAEYDGRLDADRFDSLQDRARQQANTLEEMRAEAVLEAFPRSDRSSPSVE
jgi:hypothetical protein